MTFRDIDRTGLTLSHLLLAVTAIALVLLSPSIAAAASMVGARVPAAPLATEAVSQFGLTPADLHAAYALPKTGARGQTIAIISAYDDPDAQADLNAYTKRFGIPSCTSANGCFRKLNQNGAASPLPETDPSGGIWITESSSGSEVARGVCQSCSIMLVEANDATENSFAGAVNTAERNGATEIVTSFEPAEQTSDSQYLADFSPANSVIVAAAGDAGYSSSSGARFPAVFPDVIAVGGTALDMTSQGKYAGETAWAGTSSGCSLYQSAPAWQSALAQSVGCGAKRSVVDIAAAADPGALVHIGEAGVPGGPWYQGGGTSLGAPIIAGVIGLAGGNGSAEAQLLYQHAHNDPAALRDVTSGSDSLGCQMPICAARRGYDGPTGLGTPYGLAAFLRSGGALDPHHPRISVSASHNRLLTGTRWTTRVSLVNGNAFALSGSISVRGRLRTSGRLRLIEFATARLRLAPLGTDTSTLTIANRFRALLKGAGSANVTVDVSLRGPAGRSASVAKRLRLYAP